MTASLSRGLLLNLMAEFIKESPDKGEYRPLYHYQALSNIQICAA
jgi:hypothetical protein